MAARFCSVSTLGFLAMGLWGTGLLPRAMSADHEQPVTFSEGAPKNAELASLQGTWVRMQRDAKGHLLRVEKRIEGNRETITVSQVDGGKRTVLSQTQAEISVKKADPVRVFTFRNLTYTAGKLKGSRIATAQSYLYQIRGNALFVTFGMLNSDRGRRVTVQVFQRQKPQISAGNHD